MKSKEYKSLSKQYQLFSWSQPVGYDFKEVQEAIEKYKITISDIGELLDKKDSIIEALKEENSRLVNELANMRIQMESLIVPNYSEEESLEILEDFKEKEKIPVPNKSPTIKVKKKIIE